MAEKKERRNKWSFMSSVKDCHRKQSLKNQTCRACAFDLKKARRQNDAPYWIYIRHQGKQHWRRVGESLTVAREQQAVFKAELVKNEYQPKGRKHISIKTYFERYYLPSVKLKNRAWDKDESRFRLHVGPYFGAKKIKDVTVEDVENYKRELRVKI